MGTAAARPDDAASGRGRHGRPRSTPTPTPRPIACDGDLERQVAEVFRTAHSDQGVEFLEAAAALARREPLAQIIEHHDMGRVWIACMRACAQDGRFDAAHRYHQAASEIAARYAATAAGARMRIRVLMARVTLALVSEGLAGHHAALRSAVEAFYDSPWNWTAGDRLELFHQICLLLRACGLRGTELQLRVECAGLPEAADDELHADGRMVADFDAGVLDLLGEHVTIQRIEAGHAQGPRRVTPEAQDPAVQAGWRGLRWSEAWRMGQRLQRRGVAAEAANARTALSMLQAETSADAAQALGCARESLRVAAGTTVPYQLARVKLRHELLRCQADAPSEDAPPERDLLGALLVSQRPMPSFFRRELHYLSAFRQARSGQARRGTQAFAEYVRQSRLPIALGPRLLSEGWDSVARLLCKLPRQPMPADTSGARRQLKVVTESIRISADESHRLSVAEVARRQQISPRALQVAFRSVGLGSPAHELKRN